MGALAAALVERRPAGSAPLALMAAKSWSGHAEPGAGEGWALWQLVYGHVQWCMYARQQV